MCTICIQWEMYKDRNEVREMARKAREEKLPIPEEHLQELEQAMDRIDRTLRDIQLDEDLQKMDF